MKSVSLKKKNLEMPYTTTMEKTGEHKEEERNNRSSWLVGCSVDFCVLHCCLLLLLHPFLSLFLVLRQGSGSELSPAAQAAAAPHSLPLSSSSSFSQLCTQNRRLSFSLSLPLRSRQAQFPYNTSSYSSSLSFSLSVCLSSLSPTSLPTRLWAYAQNWSRAITLLQPILASSSSSSSSFLFSSFCQLLCCPYRQL